MAEIRYSESLEIAASSESIYDYRLDFNNLPSYNPTVSNLVQLNDKEYEFDLLMEGAPEPLRSPLRVTLAERPAHIVFETGPGYMATEDCTFKPSGGSTLVTFDYTISIPGELDDATIKMISEPGREQARMELENMKKILEG
ncbi:MAG: SRPBCC family protein [Actinomycetota bacterium]